MTLHRFAKGTFQDISRDRIVERLAPFETPDRDFQGIGPTLEQPFLQNAPIVKRQRGSSNTRSRRSSVSNPRRSPRADHPPTTPFARQVTIERTLATPLSVSIRRTHEFIA